jgi:hypothetical protein
LKNNVLEDKVSAQILSNLGEFYYITNMYSKAIIALSLANYYYSKKEQNEGLYYKNHALIVMSNWKLFEKKVG